MSKIWIAAAAVVFVAGCSVKVEHGHEGGAGVKLSGGKQHGEKAHHAGYALPAGSVKIGEEITVTESVQLASVKQSPADYFEKTILVEATAGDVCQSRGCWMTVTDGEGDPIWVRWSTGCGGKYAFPKDCSGKRVIVQGSIYEKEIDTKAAEHLAGESKGLEADEIVGKTFEMNATACVILPAKSEAEPS